MKYIRISLAIIVILLSLTGLFFNKSELLPYVYIGLSVWAFVMGIDVLIKNKRKIDGYLYIAISLAVLFVLRL